MKLLRIFIYFLNFFIFFSKNKELSDSKSSIFSIQVDIDSLINKLSSANLSKINLNSKDQKKFLHKGQEKNLKDEILNAFQDLNNDFQGYQKILNGEAKPIKDILSIQHLEQNLNKTMSINNIKLDKQEILKEISEYSGQIDKAFSVLDQINDFDKKIKNKKSKIALVNKLKSYLQNLGKVIDVSKSRVNIKKQLYNSIKNITFLYQDYFNTHKFINHALVRRFNLLKNQFQETSKIDNNINHSIKLFKRIVNFQKILQEDKDKSEAKSNNKKSEVKGIDKDMIIKTYTDFLSKLSEIDENNQELKTRLFKRIEDVSNSQGNIKYIQKLEILSKMITFSKILINLNDRVLVVKKMILNSLKKYSLQDLNDLMEISKKKSSDVSNKFKKLENLKNTLKFVHSAFSNNKKNLNNLKGSIVNNLNNIDEKLLNIENYKKYPNQLTSIIERLYKNSNSNSEFNNIFQEIKSRKINNTNSFSPKKNFKQKRKDAQELDISNNNLDRLAKNFKVKGEMSSIDKKFDNIKSKFKNLTSKIEKDKKSIKFFRKYPIQNLSKIDERKTKNTSLIIPPLQIIDLKLVKNDKYPENKSDQNKKSEELNLITHVKNHDKKPKIQLNENLSHSTIEIKKSRTHLGKIHDELINTFSDVVNYKKGIL